MLGLQVLLLVLRNIPFHIADTRVNKNGRDKQRQSHEKYEATKYEGKHVLGPNSPLWPCSHIAQLHKGPPCASFCESPTWAVRQAPLTSRLKGLQVLVRHHGGCLTSKSGWLACL